MTSNHYPLDSDPLGMYTFQAGNYRQPCLGFLFAALAAFTASFFTFSIFSVSLAFSFALSSASLMYSIDSGPVK